MINGIFEYLPHDRIRAAFERSPGNEIASGKLANPESSAALAAITFGFFLNQPSALAPLPGTLHCGWPAESVYLEEPAPFPWAPRGQQPWLDALVETSSHIIGIESKRYEPFRSKPRVKFSDVYSRQVWGDHMGPFEDMRDGLSEGLVPFERLDAAQLVKHAFGLRTEAKRRQKSAHLVYLFAEPAFWSDGTRIPEADIETHREELLQFSDAVANAEVTFSHLSYSELIQTLLDVAGPVGEHARRVESMIYLQSRT